MNDPLEELQVLAGVKTRPLFTEYKGYPGSNISVTGNEKGKLMRKHNIRPGTDEWFRLWFSKPYLTGERPI
jgi:hypothetical protein